MNIQRFLKSGFLAGILTLFALGELTWSQNEEGLKTWRKLTPAEERVIVNKGTEQPFSGRFDNFHEAGIYVCRRCGTALYRSADKFDAGCGWPSFDAEIPGAVKRLPDADGKRTEIQCAYCGAHLGHVFTGEKMTARKTRHCVNSISMDFLPQAGLGQHFSRAIFAGGCFWGVEYYLEQATGVVQTVTGYTGGRTQRPTYKEVCRHTTGHAEAVEVFYDPRLTSFEKLTRLFFEIHDPTQLDRQGPDHGNQYRSEIFYVNNEQKEVAEQLIGELKNKGWAVVTRLEPAATFWPAEQYHQHYYQRNGKLPSCHRPEPRFNKSP
jgi:peptide methionine sulfoxide reductase msrA/msrB